MPSITEEKRFVHTLSSQVDNQIPVGRRRNYYEDDEEDDEDRVDEDRVDEDRVDEDRVDEDRVDENRVDEDYSGDEEGVGRWPIQPCRWCNPQNDRGFVCPNPLTEPGFDVIPPAHSWCVFCHNLFPEVDTLKQACDLCGARSCHSLNPHCVISELKFFRGLLPVV
jgi:hypothetical protein